MFIVLVAIENNIRPMAKFAKDEIWLLVEK